MAWGMVLLAGSEWPAEAFYNPIVGRWINRDPIEERGGRSLYGFVRNAPATGCDVLGKFEVSWIGQGYVWSRSGESAWAAINLGFDANDATLFAGGGVVFFREARDVEITPCICNPGNGYLLPTLSRQSAKSYRFDLNLTPAGRVIGPIGSNTSGNGLLHFQFAHTGDISDPTTFMSYLMLIDPADLGDPIEQQAFRAARRTWKSRGHYRAELEYRVQSLGGPHQGGGWQTGLGREDPAHYPETFHNQMLSSDTAPVAWSAYLSTYTGKVTYSVEWNHCASPPTDNGPIVSPGNLPHGPNRVGR